MTKKCIVRLWDMFDGWIDLPGGYKNACNTRISGTVTMTIKDELKKLVEDMNTVMQIMAKFTTSTVLNVEWAKGAYETLDIFKPKLEAILNKLIKEDVPYEDRPR